MEILGQGLGGVVVADTPETVRKFYLAEKDGRSERDHLSYLNGLQQQGFDIQCVIPKLLKVIGEGKWEVEGKTYTYCNRMERVPGVSARQTLAAFTEDATQCLGKNLGITAFAMHRLPATYVEQWKRKFGAEDVLLTHVLEDKAKPVLSEGSDSSVIRRVTDAAHYLKRECSPLAQESTLSHLDFSLANAQVDPDGRLYGIVDWGSFGLTNPSLSLYSLAYRAVWPHVRDQYTQLGGAVREDIAYAAAAIHLAWAPIVSRQRNFPLDADETPENFEAMWAQYENHRQGTQ
jgi:hypothetical protein